MQSRTVVSAPQCTACRPDGRRPSRSVRRIALFFRARTTSRRDSRKSQSYSAFAVPLASAAVNAGIELHTFTGENCTLGVGAGLVRRGLLSGAPTFDWRTIWYTLPGVEG